MNKKANIFAKYLEERMITCFQVEEIAQDPWNTVAFRSQMVVRGQKLPTVVIIDSSIYSIIRVLVAPAVARTAEREGALCGMLNKINRKYKACKYYVAEDGSLVLDCVILNKPEELDGNMIYTMLDTLIKHLEEVYPTLMQSVWA